MEVLKFGKDKEERRATLNTLAANKYNGEEKATSFKCFRCDTLGCRSIMKKWKRGIFVIPYECDKFGDSKVMVNKLKLKCVDHPQTLKVSWEGEHLFLGERSEDYLESFENGSFNSVPR